MRVLLLSMGLLALPLLACSGDDSSSGSKSNPSPTSGACAADTRKDIYTAGLTKPAEPAGNLSVALLESKPGPPIKGTNTMTIQVLDASKAPVDGATITVTPWMPDHAHGSSVTPKVTPQGGGKYTIDNVYLVMAGLWQIKVDVQPAGGGQLQEAIFQFCLDG